jgi:predicted O-methyltransferase YrrM
MLRRAADAAEGRAVSDETDDAAFLADGRSSGAHMRVILAALVERIPGFADLLDHGVPRFLDVGTGIGAISAELVERSPGARAQGVDVDPRALRLAEEYLDERGVRDRVETRLLDVAELSETSGYDVVWLPLSVLAPETTEAALPRIRAALRPGGWLVAATALGDEPGEGGADVHSAVVRWRMALSGVTPWGPGTVRRRLEEFGFGDVRSVGAPSGTVTVLTARAPEAPVSGD